MEQRILSVKEFNQGIKKVLESNQYLSNIYIRGEISNYTAHSSGHIYFSIKEEGSVIKAVMFNTSASKLLFKPKEGTKVVAHGSISLYVPSGQYQINVTSMKLDGLGNLHLQFEELKEKLKKEGLFSPIHKKEIPDFPKKIGVITSPTGAAIQDIITTIQRRYPIAQIILSPAVVQGVQAPESVIKAIEIMNRADDIDVLIVGRGGGSIEDLWAFNDENVARAIYNSNIPIISAVGHETDFTIADFVSDLRAPTPTAAAELATPYSITDLKETIKQHQESLSKGLRNNLKYHQQKLQQLNKTLTYFHPQKVIEGQMQRLDILHEKLEKTMIRKQERLTQRFHLHNDKFSGLMQRQLERKKQQFTLNISKLDSLSPLKIMSRGYSVVLKNNHVVKDAQQLNENDLIRIKLTNAMVDCVVTNIEEDK